MKLLTAIFLAGLTAADAAPLYFLATDQTGAQTQIDVNHTSSWLLTPNVNFDLGGGLFVMKSGNSTTEPITLTLYQGSDTSGPVLASLALTNAAFCAQASCGQFNVHQFLFASPAILSAGTTYFATLTSAANDVQSQAYFIKNDFYFISDINGTAVTPQPVTFGSGGGSSTGGSTAGSGEVPEPGSLSLLAAGVLLVAGLRNRRRSA